MASVEVRRSVVVENIAIEIPKNRLIQAPPMLPPGDPAFSEQGFAAVRRVGARLLTKHAIQRISPQFDGASWRPGPTGYSSCTTYLGEEDLCALDPSSSQ